MEIRVEYQEGLGGEPEPAVVWFGERRLAVQAITDRWYGTDRRWWKLQTEDGLYVLRRDDASGQWEVAAVARSQLSRTFNLFGSERGIRSAGPGSR